MAKVACIIIFLFLFLFSLLVSGCATTGHIVDKALLPGVQGVGDPVTTGVNVLIDLINYMATKKPNPKQMEVKP